MGLGVDLAVGRAERPYDERHGDRERKGAHDHDRGDEAEHILCARLDVAPELLDLTIRDFACAMNVDPCNDQDYATAFMLAHLSIRCVPRRSLRH